MDRTIAWFSAGAASAVAAKLTLKDTPDAIVAYIDTGSEHPDNARFVDECEEWLGKEIVRLKSEKWRDIWHVFETKKFLVSPLGARCTIEMKKRVRMAFELPTDTHVFGYTNEEKSRALRFVEQNPGMTLRTPLIEHDLSKSDCLAMIDRAGIEIPMMYKLGYQNNNCVGCVKGGIGYWNKIRRDFPDVFERMSKLERDINATILRDHATGEGIFLDEMDPNRGNHADEPNFECSLMCHLAEEKL